MSALELLEQIGANASLNLNNDAESAVIRQQAIDAMDQLDQPPAKKWCILLPAEEEQKEDDSEQQPEEEPEKDEQAKH